MTLWGYYESLLKSLYSKKDFICLLYTSDAADEL